MITNRQCKELQELGKKAKARRETGLFVAEGERIVREIPAALLQRVYVSESYASAEKVPEQAEILTDAQFLKIADTKTPQGILAVARIPAFAKEIRREKKGLYLLLEAIQDPGNLGTIFRVAEGAGVSAIFLDKKTADPYAPKAVRSTMGSIFRMPHFFTEDAKEVVLAWKQQGIRAYAAHLSGTLRYDQADYRDGTAFLIGNEGNGLSEELAALSDERIVIPMGGQLESLNAGVAASLLVYEAARQRGFQ